MTEPYDVERFARMVIEGKTLRTIAKHFEVSTQTVRLRILRLDAEVPGIFGNRVSRDSIISPESYQHVARLVENDERLQDIALQTGLSSTKVSLAVLLIKTDKGQMKRLINEKMKKRLLKMKETSPHTKSVRVTPNQVYVLFRDSKASQADNARKLGLSIKEAREIFKNEHSRRFPNNQGIQAHFDIRRFLSDVRANTYSWDTLGRRYNITAKDAFRWAKKLRLFAN